MTHKTHNPLPSHTNTDHYTVLYIPNETHDWELQNLDQRTTRADRFVVEELSYTTTINNDTYNIHIEHTGTGYTGTLYNLNALANDASTRPLKRFNTGDALTLDEMLDELTNWLTIEPPQLDALQHEQ